MGEKLTIGVVAKRLGLRPSAVRFYERHGIVTAERLANGYRVYDRDAIKIHSFVSRDKALGFSLEEVREILSLRRQGPEPCVCVRQMIARNLALIERRIAELSGLRRQLRALAKKPAGRRDARAICPILETDV